MVTQTYFLDLNEIAFTNNKNTRERPLRWKNFYSVYAYDYTAYHEFCKDLLGKFAISPLAISFTKKKLFLSLLVYHLILEHARQVGEAEYRKWFFILDKNRKKQHRSDEKHIFRIPALHKIYEQIYNFCPINPFNKFDIIKCKGLNVCYDDKQAEIIGSELLSIKERLKLHIKLLRLLKNGYNVENAVTLVKRDIIKIYD